MDTTADPTVENRKAVENWIEDAWNRLGVDVSRYCDPSFIFHDPVMGEVCGIAGVENFLATMRGAFPDIRMTIEDLIAEDDRVVVRSSLRGTHLGMFMGVAPTGNPVVLAGIAVIRLRQGKFVEAWQQWDALGALQQCGVAH